MVLVLKHSGAAERSGKMRWRTRRTILALSQTNAIGQPTAKDLVFRLEIGHLASQFPVG
jgi:hypothetical protein